MQISLGRRVALKVLPFAAALDAKQLQRFKNEAQAAAHLHHTNIVPVHAVGCERGVHFYAMQFIEGQTLAAVIAELRQQAGKEDRGSRIEDRRSRIEDRRSQVGEEGGTIEDRGPGNDTKPASPLSSILYPLSSFFRTVAHLGVQAAEALEHAHQTGIIHRDIKPANLLADGGGRLWITDFGLAHCQSQPGLTMTGDVVGTLRYMSPEQALAKRGLVDHRTDIYSLGVTLYELLTLEPAYTGRDREELLRQIALEEPRPPRRLNKAIPAELETIVLKAIEKNAAERYATAQELADDLERFLKDEPIRARRPTLVHKARKWGRRNRAVVVTAGLAAVALLVTAVVALTLGLVAVNREKERTQAALNAEQQAALGAEAARAAEAKRRQQARDALDDMTSLMLGDLLAKQKVLTEDHKKFLRKALGAYTDFAADAGQDEQRRAGVAQAHWRVGSIRERLGEHQDAEIAYREAIARFQQLALGRGLETSPSAAVPEHRQYLAWSHAKLAGLLSATGRPQQAEAAYRDALGLLEQLATDFPAAPQYRQDLAKTYTNLGNLLQTTGRWREGEAAYDKAVTLLERLAADFPTVPAYRHELADTRRNLGVLLRQSSRPQEAEAAYRAALAVDQQLAAAFPTVAEYRADLARSHNELGILFHGLGRSQEAEAAFRDAIAVKKQLAADFPNVPEHREKLGNSYNNLGAVLGNAGRHPEAEAANRDALAIRKQLAADFPNVPSYQLDLAVSHSNLALVLLAIDRKPEAEAQWRAALKVLHPLAVDFPTTAEYQRALAVQYVNLGIVLRRTDRPQEAETAYGEALAIYQRLAADFPKVSDYQNELAGTMGNLARLLHARKEFLRARELLEQALPYHQAALAAYPRHPVYRKAYCDNRRSLTDTLLALGEHAAAALTAEELVLAAVDPANDLYDTACFLARCLPLAEKDGKLPADERKELPRKYGDRALQLLRQAVQNGYEDIEHMKKDKDLDPLRSREDFRKLLAGREGKKQSN